MLRMLTERFAVAREFVVPLLSHSPEGSTARRRCGPGMMEKDSVRRRPERKLKVLSVVRFRANSISCHNRTHRIRDWARGRVRPFNNSQPDYGRDPFRPIRPAPVMQSFKKFKRITPAFIEDEVDGQFRRSTGGWGHLPWAPWVGGLACRGKRVSEKLIGGLMMWTSSLIRECIFVGDADRLKWLGRRRTCARITCSSNLYSVLDVRSKCNETRCWNRRKAPVICLATDGRTDNGHIHLGPFWTPVRYGW